MNNNREKIIEKVNIVDEIASTISLERKGKNFLGLCPFHSDNNPSFTVSSEKQIYKCFVCGEGGDVVKFYRKYNNVSNQVAIEELAQKYNIKIVKNETKIHMQNEHKLLNDINRFYVTTLHSTQSGNEAIDYLKKRGFTIDVINQFHLGYGYEQNEKLYEYVINKIDSENEYSVDIIDNINHFTNKRDIFKQRITIPIYDNNVIVGFGGRTLKSDSIKYLNSKDSKIFNKNKILFNFDQALKMSPDNSLIVVEGFFDVIKAYQNNIKNVIGLMGTSFTSDHIKKMKQKNIKTIFLALDTDNAGTLASLKIGTLLLNNQFNVKVIVFDRVKDLDEYFLSNNYDNFLELKRSSLNFKIFETNCYINNIKSLSLDEKDNILNKLLRNLSLENELVIEEVLTKIETNMNVSRAFLEKKLNKNKITKPIVENNENNNNKIKYEIPRSNVNFMSTIELVIFRAISNKDDFIELERLKQQYNKNFNEYEQVFTDLKGYYSKYSKFDYVTYTNSFPQYSLIINKLYEKKIFKNNMTNEQLIIKIQNKKSWGIFGDRRPNV